jgi:hypothetical protein
VLELHPEQLTEPSGAPSQRNAPRRRIFRDHAQLVAPSPRRHALAIRMSPRVLPAHLINAEVFGPRSAAVQPRKALLYRRRTGALAQHHGQLERLMPLCNAETARAPMTGTRSVKLVVRAAR